MREVQSQGIEKGRAPEPPDAVREKYRHLLEKKSADLTPHPSAGYGRNPEAGPKPSEPKQQISPELKRAAADHMKGVTKIQQEAKGSEGQQRTQPVQQQPRSGRER